MLSSDFWATPKMAVSNLEYLSSRTVFPQTPPRVVTMSLMPSRLLTFNCSGFKRTTFWKADPRHWRAARGASWLRCSGGQIPARNSSRREYSDRSVSPGSKAGIKCHGKWEADPPGPIPVPTSVVAACSDIGGDIQQVLVSDSAPFQDWAEGAQQLPAGLSRSAFLGSSRLRYQCELITLVGTLAHTQGNAVADERGHNPIQIGLKVP